MHSRQLRISGALLAILALGLAGCATPVSTNIKPSSANIAKYNDLSDLAVVAALEKNLGEAKAANMPFLAPHYFQEASQVLSECQSGLGNKPKDVLVATAAKGDAILEKGRAVMTIVQYRFAKELELKSQLDARNTAKLLPKEYDKVIGNLSGLIEKVEREQPGNLDKDKEALLKAMQDLEIKAVQEGALRESENINADSKKKNAEAQAPATYAEALRVYQDAKKQIAAAPHDDKLVQRLGEQALFAARHAQQVNDRVALLQAQLKVTGGGGGASLSGMSGGVAGTQLGMQVGGGSAAVEKATLEKVVLDEDDRLHAISAAMGLKDLRDLPLEKQVEEIKRAAGESARGPKKELVQDLEARLKTANDATAAATAQLAEKDAQIKALSDKVAQLESAAKPAAKAKSAKPAKK